MNSFCTALSNVQFVPQTSAKRWLTIKYNINEDKWCYMLIPGRPSQLWSHLDLCIQVLLCHLTCIGLIHISILSKTFHKEVEYCTMREV